MRGPEPPPDIARLIAEATALYQVSGWSYAEIAAHMDEPEDQVRLAVAKFAAAGSAAGGGAMIVLCTGSRQWTDKSVVYVALAMFRDIWPVEVFHGGATGADQLVEDVCREYGIPTRLFLPGPYRGRGKPAPLVRNDAMLDELQPARDMVVAFMLGRPERGGTLYTVEGARDRGLRVVVWNWPGDRDYRVPPDQLALAQEAHP